MVKEKNRTFLVVSLSVILIIIIANVFYAINKMSLIGDRLDEVVNGHMFHAISVDKLIYHARERSLLLYQHIATDDEFEKERFKEIFFSHGAEFIRHRNEILNSGLSVYEQHVFDQQGAITRKVVPLQYRVIELSESGRVEEARKVLFKDAVPLQNNIIALLSQFVDMQGKQTRDALEVSSDAYLYTIRITFLSILMVLIVGGVLVYKVVQRFAMINKRLSYREQEVLTTNKVLEQKVSELKLVSEQLFNSEQYERAIRENMLDAVVTVNAYGMIESCNQATEKMFGYSVGEMLGKNVSMLMPDYVSNKHDKYMEGYRKTGQALNMDIIRSQYGMRKDGSVFPVDIGISRMPLKNEVKVVGIMRDITDRVEAEKIMQRSQEELAGLVQLRTVELEEANQRLLHLARHDALTGLANRNLLEENLKVAIAYARRNEKKVGFMFVDLDGFKDINDEYGHEVGDRLLQDVARKLESHIRIEDCASRIGGDEFVLMLFALEDGNNVSVVAQRIIEDLSRGIMINNSQVKVGVSIGISLFPDDAEDCNQLVKCADEAMYQVKRSGKNNYGFYNQIKSS